jgi:hypothetical protein
MINNPNDPYSDQRDTALPGRPVRDPADWRAQDFKDNEEWLYHFTDDDISELKLAVQSHDHPHVDLIGLSRKDFHLPSLEEKLLRFRQELLYGRGFINFRGLSVDSFGKRGAAIAFWAISCYLGDGMFSQNKRGHVLGHVTDLGESKENTAQRGPFSGESIPFHVDAADLVGLLCVEPAKTGGESSLISSVAVHNEILEQRPDLLPVLFEPYARDRRDEVPPGMAPWYHLAVFHIHQGYFAASIEPTYMGSAERFDEIETMTAQQREALDLVQKIAAAECFKTNFNQGDMQFLNNHVIFHSRDAFEDYESPGRRRHLIRVWLKAMDARPLSPNFYARHGRIEDIDRPGGIIGSDTVLSAPLNRQ